MSSSDPGNKVETSRREDGKLNVWAWIIAPTIKDQKEPLDPKYKRWVLIGVIEPSQDPRATMAAILRAHNIAP